MERLRISERILQALIFAILLLVTIPAAAGADAELIRTFSVEDFGHSELHEDSPDAREAQRCFKVVEDEGAQGGKALRIRLSKPLIRKDDFAVLRTPGAGGLDTGT